MRYRSRPVRSALLLLALLALVGCAHYRASPTGAGGAAVTTEGRETVWVFAWGLASTPALYVDNCGDGPLAEVTVSTNLAFSLLHVATLGIVSPHVVEWKCGKCATEGVIGEATPGGPIRARATEVSGRAP